MTDVQAIRRYVGGLRGRLHDLGEAVECPLALAAGAPLSYLLRRGVVHLGVGALIVFVLSRPREPKHVSLGSCHHSRRPLVLVLEDCHLLLLPSR